MAFTRTELSNNVLRSEKRAPVMDVVLGATCDLRVSNAFAVKDALKARGFRFDDTSSNWVKTVDATRRNEAMDDIIWADDNKIELRTKGGVVPVAKIRTMRAAS